MAKRIKPYRKRKPYKRKQGGGTFMLPGGRFGQSASPEPEEDKAAVLAQLFAKLSQMFQGFKGFHSKRR